MTNISRRVQGRSLELSIFVIKFFGEFWLIFLLYPYHFSKVQALLYKDFSQRVNFCRWYLQNVTTLNSQSESQTMSTNEANVSRNAIKNFHTNLVLAKQNPNSITETHFEEQFSVNVWAAIIGNNIIWPCFFGEHALMDSVPYILAKKNYIIMLLENVSVALRNQMWYCSFLCNYCS